MNIPRSTLLAGSIRGDEIIVSTGDTVVEFEDRLIIFVRKHVIAKVEKFISV